MTFTWIILKFYVWNFRTMWLIRRGESKLLRLFLNGQNFEHTFGQSIFLCIVTNFYRKVVCIGERRLPILTIVNLGEVNKLLCVTWRSLCLVVEYLSLWFGDAIATTSLSISASFSLLLFLTSWWALWSSICSFCFFLWVSPFFISYHPILFPFLLGQHLY